MKNKYFIVILFYFSSLSCFSQAGQWTWMGGSAGAVSSPGSFGTLGVPSATNVPPGIYEGVYWTDLQGNFWIFGGVNNWPVLNDLWKYDPSINQWTWIKGSGGLLDQPGVYGTLGVPSALNNPGARGWGASSWTDNVGDLWMYSGYGIDATGGVGDLTDLWRYNIATNQWTWIKGDNVAALLGSYGVQGVANATNLPPGRDETNASWKDLAGDLWMFGGSSGAGSFNDLWRYNISTNIFTWMKGSNISNQIGVYGTLGIPNPSNTPGARFSYTRSVDLSGDLWLFGGSGYSDVWKYEILSNQWVWMDGQNITGTLASYGILCDTSQLNLPESFKSENRACWADQCGNFINFGGFSYNDLWFYDVTNLSWLWIGGTNTTGAIGNYGTLGVMSATNDVPERGGSCGFMDNAGNFWLFGGYGNFNDLWKYTITDSTCLPGNCFTSVPPPPPTPTPIPAVNTELFIPNVFSPNGDIENNLFTIKANGYKTYHLEIYNRWGQKVFESDDSQIHWNGKINNANMNASDGTYYYILDLSNSNDVKSNYKGFLTLTR